MHKLLVYGTLQRDQPNHYLLTQPGGAWQFLDRAQTEEKWPLIITTPVNIPFVLDKRGTGNHIEGDMILVDDAKLKVLDTLEGHPDFYTRVQIQARRNRDTTAPDAPEPEAETCWLYMIQRPRADLLSLPMYCCYDSQGDHGLRYTLPRERTDVDTHELIRMVKDVNT